MLLFRFPVHQTAAAQAEEEQIGSPREQQQQ